MIKSFRTLLILVILNSTLITAQNSWIRVNQLGYKPNSVKVAVLASKENISIDSFKIVEVLTDKIVHTGNDIRRFGPYASFTNLYRLDFSDFNEPGTYYIIANDTVSSRIKIAEDIYNGSADFLLKYMRQQRCGFNPFFEDSCHTHDGFIVDRPGYDSVHIDVTGGWHDASDYLQYVTTSANATYQMLFAYKQNPDAFGDEFDKDGLPGSNGIPDILDEAKWGLDWLNKMNPSYGIMYNQIADDRDHMKFTLPTLDTISYGKGLERPVYFVTGKSQGLAKYKNRTTGVSSTAAKFASAFGLGAELLNEYYPEFSKTISSKAEDAYRFAGTDLGVCQTASNRSPYFYEEDNYVDDMELAAAQLFLNTNDSSYIHDAAYWGDVEPVTPWMGVDTARHYQWYPFVNLGHFLLAKNETGLTKQKFLGFLRKGIENIKIRAKANGFNFGIPFIWCSNNLVAAALTQISLYKNLTGDNSYDELEASLRDWLFGCNPWGTSMIVGFPREDADIPTDPHSALSAAFNMNIDGGLVDGPVYTSIFNRLKGLRIVNGDEYEKFQSDLCVYHDDYGDYSTNEPTMDGTASLTYYLSSLEHQQSEENNLSESFGAIIRGDSTLKNIYLVFTGGDYSKGGAVISETLRSNIIPANFFFTGDFYRKPENKSLIKKLVKDGHYLGAHSDSHLLYAPWENRDSLLVTKEEFLTDLANNYKEMSRFGIDKIDAPYFLPPYEWFNSTISRWTKELGLTLINFTPGTRSNADYTTPGMVDKYVDSDTIYESILSKEKNSSSGLNGFILLLHIGTSPERTDKFYYRLDKLLRELISRGYEFKRLDPNQSGNL